MIRQNIGTLKRFKGFQKKLQQLLANGSIFKFSETSRNQAESIFKLWMHHCECVFAQRLRRCQQMFFLYTKLWEERALRDILKRMRNNLTKKGKEIAFSAAGISAYNWDQNRIPDDDFKEHNKEFDYIYTLKEKTICLACDPTSRSDNNTNICKCGTSGKLPTTDYEEWVPFIEKQDLIVWRRLRSSGCYEYKVYGSYPEVTAEDFLNVQIDNDYRRKWDTTAVVLEVGETEQNSNSDIIYWEMLWPRLFVNRDYVYNRRYWVDEENNTMFILSKSTDHPKFPKYPDKYRIEDYWSCMVIRPYEDIRKPGLEFSLTYYDNPGVNIPSSVTTWVAMRAMPDFLEKLRQATKNYRDYCVKEGISRACMKIVEEEKAEAEKREREKLDYCSFLRLTEKIRFSSIYLNPRERNAKTDMHGANSGNVNTVNVDTPDISGNVELKHKSIWRYLHPLYYFQ